MATAGHISIIWICSTATIICCPPFTPILARVGSIATIRTKYRCGAIAPLRVYGIVRAPIAVCTSAVIAEVGACCCRGTTGTRSIAVVPRYAILRAHLEASQISGSIIYSKRSRSTLIVGIGSGSSITYPHTASARTASPGLTGTGSGTGYCCAASSACSITTAGSWINCYICIITIRIVVHVSCCRTGGYRDTWISVGVTIAILIPRGDRTTSIGRRIRTIVAVKRCQTGHEASPSSVRRNTCLNHLCGSRRITVAICIRHPEGRADFDLASGDDGYGSPGRDEAANGDGLVGSNRQGGSIGNRYGSGIGCSCPCICSVYCPGEDTGGGNRKIPACRNCTVYCQNVEWVECNYSCKQHHTDNDFNHFVFHG